MSASKDSNVKVRNIGIVYPGLKPPEKVCSDKKCPWHGNVSVRGLILVGKVVKAKMQNTVVVQREYTVGSENIKDMKVGGVKFMRITHHVYLLKKGT